MKKTSQLNNIKMICKHENGSGEVYDWHKKNKDEWICNKGELDSRGSYIPIVDIESAVMWGFADILEKISYQSNDCKLFVRFYDDENVIEYKNDKAEKED